MATVLVTGASGFVGTALVPQLAAAGWQVRAAARNIAALPRGERVEPALLPDLTGPVDWAPLLAGVSHVVHLAGIAHRGGTDVGVYDRAIRVATASLAAACRQQNVSRLVYISSIGAQTGSAADHAVREEDFPCPVTPYDRAKLATEAEVRDAGIPHAILRPSLVYGPGVKGNMALLMRLARSPWPLPFGCFDNRRSLLALDNLNDAIGFCLDADVARDQLYVVADQTPVSLAEMIVTLRQAIGRSARLVGVSPALARSILLMLGRRAMWDRIGGSLVVDPGKLMRAGWRPRIATADGLRAMMRATYPRG